MAPRDSDQTWVFRQRPGFFLAGAFFVLLLSIIPLAIGAVVLITSADEQGILIGLGYVLFSVPLWAAGLNGLKRAFWGDAVIMRLDSRGLWHRLSTRDQVIEWPLVDDIYMGGGIYTRGTRVRVDRTAYETLFPSAWEKAFHSGRWLGTQPVLAIHTGGLDARPRHIHDLITSYAAAHGGLRAKM